MTETPPDRESSLTEQTIDATTNSPVADELFDALSHQRRRYAISCLDEHERPLSLPDLADEVAVREYETTITDISAEEVKRVYASLWHSHIPKLESIGIVAYDQESDMVTLSEEFARIEPILDFAETKL